MKWYTAAIALFLALFPACAGSNGALLYQDPPADDTVLKVSIEGNEGPFPAGGAAELRAGIEYNGHDNPEYLWFIENRQVGNGPVLKLEGKAYRQAEVRLLVKAGVLLAEATARVQWVGAAAAPGDGQLPGSVVISSVYPNRHLVDGQKTVFTVHISCSLPEDIQARVKVLFNNGSSADDYRIHYSDTISGGIGNYIFDVEAVPKYWGHRNDFVIFVMVSAGDYKTGLSDKLVLDFTAP
ncbi:MAG: hypothetical protein JW874_01270 [Spirochaetales bacterium]|nr:hypothetical protein [Spirochaetales bacterium]